jgi:translocator protein
LIERQQHLKDICVYIDMKKILLSIVLCVAIGSFAGFVTAGEASGDWFLHINKPSFQPPNWLFAPVWTTLYILMGIALGKVWQQPPSSKRNTAIALFLAQLFFNFWWSILFFKWHLISVALADILLLWILLLLTIVSFAKHSKLAAWLLVPYISWVSFATILNYAIWRLN